MYMNKCKLYKDGKCPYLGKVECLGIILFCDYDEFIYIF